MAVIIEQQSQNFGITFGFTSDPAGVGLAETFTPASTFLLTTVQLRLAADSPTPNFKVNIGTGDPLTGNVLGTVEMTPAEIIGDYAVHTFDFTAQNITLTTGQEYFFSMEEASTPAEAGIYGAQVNLEDNLYQGGVFWSKGSASAGVWSDQYSPDMDPWFIVSGDQQQEQQQETSLLDSQIMAVATSTSESVYDNSIAAVTAMSPTIGVVMAALVLGVVARRWVIGLL